ncbi:winged helix-turn-helix transcriptional regulator [Catenuloplanes indicus]|uniref:DNA-binding HxlR family transcriptional regulator n=1 Tax=Catenuloplanes indicus TaxID=137267 RepID=A0AAE4AV01_9ACTN|nr:winged helix-turn-helix transcriptional regulator [Catenuloplanes indicus]MDQ0364350.1 DNA-binding HxlR family transcriptional regulator [Catenuloplanes indicus]
MQWIHSGEAECRRASRALEVVGQRWSPGILIALARGTERFTEIAASVAGISARMLSVRTAAARDRRAGPPHGRAHHAGGAP